MLSIPVRVRKARRSGTCPVCCRLVLISDLIASVRGEPFMCLAHVTREMTDSKEDTMPIVHPAYRCADGCDTQLYHSPRNNGHGVEIAPACEHEIRSWYPDAPEQLDPVAPEATCRMPGRTAP